MKEKIYTLEISPKDINLIKHNVTRWFILWMPVFSLCWIFYRHVNIFRPDVSLLSCVKQYMSDWTHLLTIFMIIAITFMIIGFAQDQPKENIKDQCSRILLTSIAVITLTVAFTLASKMLLNSY